MKNPHKEKILVAVDGSERSINTVKYIGKSGLFKDLKIVLFHVMYSFPESYQDIKKEPFNFIRNTNAVYWEKQVRQEMEQFMTRATDILVKEGINPKNIVRKIQLKKKGIARDIISESKKGYAALVTRRRGFGVIPDLFVGSVASKLLSKSSSVPLIIGGRELVSKKILVGLDGSERSVKALNFVIKRVKDTDSSVTLLHVVRDPGEEAVKFAPYKEFLTIAKQRMDELFEKGTKKLMDAGISKDKIDTKIIVNNSSRAGAIASEAAKGGYGTIVVGRKGHSRVRDFFIGRVSLKIVYAARKHSVWIV